MKILSYITHYYNNRSQAQKIVENVNQFSDSIKKRIEFILVDDGSWIETRFDLSSLDNIQIRIEDDIPWNQGGARNLAYSQTKGKFVFFTDIDHLLGQESIEVLLDKLETLDEKTMYRFKRRDVRSHDEMKPHVNSFVCSRTQFQKVGGYDLDFCGYYGHEDTYLADCWAWHGGSIKELPIHLDYFTGKSTEKLSRDTERNRNLLIEKRKTRQMQSHVKIPECKWEKF